MKTIEPYREYLSGAAVLLFLSAAVLGLYASGQISTTRQAARSLPEELPDIPETDPHQETIAREIDRLENTRENTDQLLRNRNNRTRNLLVQAQVEKSVETGNVEAMTPLGHEAYQEAISEHFQEDDEEDRSRRWEDHARNMVGTVLNLAEHQTESVWETLRQQRREQDQVLEEFSERFGEDEAPSESDLRNLEYELNNSYNQTLSDLQSELSSNQYERYQNWNRTVAQRFSRARERLPNGGVITSNVRGDRVEVSYREPSEDGRGPWRGR